MSSAVHFALRWSRASAVLALSFCGCSSEGADSVPPAPFGSSPLPNGATSEMPNAPADSADGNSSSDTSALSPNTSSAGSERPAAPELTQPDTTDMAEIEPTSTEDNEGAASPPAASDDESATDDQAEVDGEVDPSADSLPPRPSAMCGSGGASLSFNLPNTLFSVPESYDGSTPLPVVLAFHAAGNPNTQMRGIIGNTFADDYIMLYPKSDGNGWSNQADAPKVDAMFAALDAAACYDQNRVFAAGHSSGAQFIVQRLCAGENRWRAVAPVASSVYCSSWQPIPALVIHGIGDVERQAYGLDDGDGLKDIVPYQTSNGCQQSFQEVAVDGCNSGGVQVNPGCRDFDGCSETTRWCQHNDPQYGTSHHGVPCFGARVMKSFFDAYQ